MNTNKEVNKGTPPRATVRRLSMYLRTLNSLEDAGTLMVSSRELAAPLGLNPAQVRKDIAYFGEFGRRGVGYNVARLRDHLAEILGMKTRRMVGIVGAGGHLGHALALHKGFEKRNFKVVALFDKDPRVIGQVLGENAIQHISELSETVKRLNIEILMLAVPATELNSVFDYILLSGITAVLNFAPVRLPSTDEICVHNVDLAVELEYLTFHLDRNSVVT
ncbi:MAG: redox-sensing transcriptional repressor Rex [Candidatus Riflebacteria bacterium]|nr:redox-sensing transcriptional repressor Rex [Candidatus Riflebacteria bacterium]